MQQNLTPLVMKSFVMKSFFKTASPLRMKMAFTAFLILNSYYLVTSKAFSNHMLRTMPETTRITICATNFR
jgi:hypothetical protein